MLLTLYKMQKNNILLLKKLKNTESAQLCTVCVGKCEIETCGVKNKM